jgi:tetratricopeptide (TPR) repeat protein
MLYQVFDTTESFEKLVLNNLQKLLIEYSQESKTPITPEVELVLAPRISSNLPRRQAFFGRTQEMKVVMRALNSADRTWGVLIDGIGGIGKTALAIEAAHRAMDEQLFDVCLFVTAKPSILAPGGIRKQAPVARTLEDFFDETARLLGQTRILSLSGNEKRRALINTLNSLHVLLIYDNLETVPDKDVESMADLLRELPQGCKAIITSRRRGGEGANWLRLEKLEWDAARSIIENEIEHDIGLKNKLQLVESRWRELYDKTDGSPLALVHILGLMRVRTALTFIGALEMLDGNRNTDLQEFIFQEAIEELTPNEKLALSALSFFQRSATFNAWMYVANLSRKILEMTIDRLNTLALVDVLTGEERYALHPLTRAFVRDQLLSDTNISYEIGLRFARYWAEYVKRHESERLDNYSVFNRLEDEWSNLESAANWLWERSVIRNGISDYPESQISNELASVLKRFLPFGGHWDEWVQSNTRAYQAALALNDYSEAGWYAHDIASIYYTRALIDKASEWAEKCAKAWAHGENKRELAAGARMRGLVARQLNEYDRAKQLYKEALSIWQELGLDEDIAVALNALGTLDHEQGNNIEAEGYFQQALELALKIGNKEFQAIYTGKLGLLSLERKEWTEARKLFDQELTIAQEIGRIELIAQSQYGLARVYEMEGRIELALPLAQESVKIYKRLQHKDLAETRELVDRLNESSKR